MFTKVLDFLKLSIEDEDKIISLYKDSRLNIIEYKEWVSKSKKTGEYIGHVQYSEIKVWNGFEFCFYGKKLDIRLKPHYFFNNWKHNANDFCAVECIQVLKSLIREFNLSPKDIRIMQIEYGLNFISPIPAQDLISFLEYHERNSFATSNDGLKFSKISGKINQSGRIGKYKRIKIYAKGIQQPMFGDVNLIRFEVHSNRTQFIKSRGIYTLEDLLALSTYEALADSLIEEFGKILFLDHHNSLDNLTKSEIDKIRDFNNSHYWYSLLQAHRNTFNNNKISYLKLLDKTNENIHQKLKLIIENKLKKLLKPCAILTP